jgi:hypothetical protein
MLLCDSAQVADGKLFVLGGGWSVTGPGPIVCGIAIKIDVPWDLANTKIPLRLSLLTEDGNVISHPTPLGDQVVQIQAEFEVGRPAGVKPGTPIDVPLAFNLGPFDLEPGARFQWVLSVNGEENADWNLTFTTRG